MVIKVLQLNDLLTGDDKNECANENNWNYWRNEL